jgi:hypothetical protein
MGKHKKSNSGNKCNSGTCTGSDGWLSVDPNRVRFQHSRIRPHFSGCGRSVVQTLKDIRDGTIKPKDLPPIQVIVGPVADDGERWYFSLNNRRLWVLKRCREEGLLENNQIRVRVRQAKSSAELERYTLQNCAVEAKFMREPQIKQQVTNEEKVHEESHVTLRVGETTDIPFHSSDDDSDKNSGSTYNAFSVLM